MRNKQLIIAVLAILTAGTLSAQPSVYYKWQNKTTKAVVCEPDAPGKDWARLAGPYSDPDCRVLEPQ